VPEFHYVSSVKGHLVTRFPSLRSSVAQYIGATRKGKTIVWDPTEVVAISEKEWQTYRREYRRCVADKSLVVRTKEDFETYVAEKTAREQKVLEEAKAKAEADAKAEAEANEPIQPTSEGSTQPAEGTSQPKGKRATR
jgi:hypothetical protein